MASKLQNLIDELCPNGVEFVKLGEVCKVQRGKRLVKSQLSDEGAYPVYHGSILPLGYYTCNNKPGDTVIVVNTGGIGGVAYIENDFWCSDGCFCIAHSKEYINKFLYYLLVGYSEYFVSRKRVGGVPTIDCDTVANLEIPLPPLPVQEEIVRILDRFTEYAAELQAELQARRSQYEYYRNHLLSFDGYDNIHYDATQADNSAAAQGKTVKWVKLGEVAEIRGRIGFRGYTRADIVDEDRGAISLSPSNIVNNSMNYEKCTYISWAKYKESPEIMVNLGDIIFTKTGSTVGKTAVVRCLIKESTINPQLVVLKNIKCNNIYLSYILKDSYFQNEVKKLTGIGSVPNVSQNALTNIPIPLPPLSEQRRIADILDRFEALTSDLQSGLPAEIAAVQEQYEYYRNKLLSFPQKTPSA